MTERDRYDRPASLIVIATGVLLIAASVPGVIWLLPREHTFNVTWGEEDGLEKAGQTQTSPGTTTEVVVPASDLLVSSVMVMAPSCVDTPGMPGDAPSTITWKLERRQGTNVTMLGGEPLTCANAAALHKEIPIHPSPDLATRSAEGANTTAARATARASLWDFAGQLNETADYVLTFSWARGASSVPPLGLPLPQAQLAATMTLQERHWVAALNEAQPEVGK